MFNKLDKNNTLFVCHLLKPYESCLAEFYEQCIQLKSYEQNRNKLPPIHNIEHCLFEEKKRK